MGGLKKKGPTLQEAKLRKSPNEVAFKGAQKLTMGRNLNSLQKFFLSTVGHGGEKRGGKHQSTDMGKKTVSLAILKKPVQEKRRKINDPS